MNQISVYLVGMAWDKLGGYAAGFAHVVPDYQLSLLSGNHPGHPQYFLGF